MEIEGEGKLVIFQPLVGIGDMIWHKPWIDQLIDKNNVVLAVKKSSQSHHLFSDTLNPDKFFFIDRNVRGKKGAHDGLFGKLKMTLDLKKIKAQRALILHHSQSYYWSAKMAGIPEIGGFGFGGEGYSTNTLPASEKDIHSLEKMAKFWEINGWKPPHQNWQINIDQKDREAAKLWLKDRGLEPGNFIVLGIGAMHHERIWPAERFADLIKLMRVKRPDLTPVLMGGPSEKPIAEKIQSQFGTRPVVEIFIPFNQAMAALSFAKSYVGNDTSLLNLSGVLGVPSLGLFSQSKPLTYVKTIHHLDILKEQDYGKSDIILSYQVADVFSWLDRNF